MGIFNFLLKSLTFSKGIYFHNSLQYDILPNDLKEDTPKAFGELNNSIVIQFDIRFKYFHFLVCVMRPFFLELCDSYSSGNHILHILVESFYSQQRDEVSI